MKLYREVLIESAEQALSMPGETVFIGITGARYDHRGDGRLRDHDGTDMAIDLAMGRSVRALVPIEAEEETVERQRLCNTTPDILARYVTPWQHYTQQEEA